MTAERDAVVPEPMVHSPNPAFEAMVNQRATALCLDAPATSHSLATVAPCRIHESAARRELMGRYIGQQGEVA